MPESQGTLTFLIIEITHLGPLKKLALPTSKSILVNLKNDNISTAIA